MIALAAAETESQGLIGADTPRLATQSPCARPSVAVLYRPVWGNHHMRVLGIVALGAAFVLALPLWREQIAMTLSAPTILPSAILRAT